MSPFGDTEQPVCFIFSANESHLFPGIQIFVDYPEYVRYTFASFMASKVFLNARSGFVEFFLFNSSRSIIQPHAED